MLVDSRAEDIVYTSLFSGWPGISARQRRARRARPGQTSEADKTKMNFGTGGTAELKAWRISGAPAERQRHSRRRDGGGAGESDGGRV